MKTWRKKSRRQKDAKTRRQEDKRTIRQEDTKLEDKIEVIRQISDVNPRVVYGTSGFSVQTSSIIQHKIYNLLLAMKN